MMDEKRSTTSPAKIAANQRNAIKSTGPRSLAGKTRSSRNALKHGLCATASVLPGESAEEFAMFRDRLWGSLRPSNALEETLVQQIIHNFFGLRRAGRIFHDLLDRVAQSRRNQNFITTRGSALPLEGELGWAYEAANSSAVDRIERHQVRLERSAYRALQALEQLRTSEIPLAVDAPVQLGLFDEVDNPPAVAAAPEATSIASIADLANLPRVPGRGK